MNPQHPLPNTALAYSDRRTFDPRIISSTETLTTCQLSNSRSNLSKSDVSSATCRKIARNSTRATKRNEPSFHLGSVQRHQVGPDYCSYNSIKYQDHIIILIFIQIIFLADANYYQTCKISPFPVRQLDKIYKFINIPLLFLLLP